jgi:hypothetical protein
MRGYSAYRRATTGLLREEQNPAGCAAGYAPRGSQHMAHYHTALFWACSKVWELRTTEDRVIAGSNPATPMRV